MRENTRSPLHLWRGAAVGLAALAAVCAAAGAAGYTRPATEATRSTLAYTHRGEFTYRAAAPAGPVYATGKVDTGDPVYLRLVPALDVHFEYTLEAEGASDASGRIALAAEIADGMGWTRRVELQPPAPFTDGQGEATGRLPIVDLQTLVAEVRASTGVHGGASSIAILAEVELDATVDGSRVRDRFDPSLLFQLDPLQLRLTDPAGADGVAPADSLRPSEAATAERAVPTPARVGVLGREITVSACRALGLGTVPAAGAALVMWRLLRRRLRRESARIQLRHGRRIVPVAATARGEHVAVVDVTTMEDLARLAEQEACLILHQRNEWGDLYQFQADRTVYRYAPYRLQEARPVA